jgi:hypothetical protein
MPEFLIWLNSQIIIITNIIYLSTYLTLSRVSCMIGVLAGFLFVGYVFLERIVYYELSTRAAPTMAFAATPTASNLAPR